MNRIELEGRRGESGQSSRHEEIFGVLEWTEEPVVDAAEQSRPELHGERATARPRGLAHSKAAGVLVELGHGLVPIDRDDLTG